MFYYQKLLIDTILDRQKVFGMASYWNPKTWSGCTSITDKAIADAKEAIKLNAPTSYHSLLLKDIEDEMDRRSQELNMNMLLSLMAFLVASSTFPILAIKIVLVPLGCYMLGAYFKRRHRVMCYFRPQNMIYKIALNELLEKKR